MSIHLSLKLQFIEQFIEKTPGSVICSLVPNHDRSRDQLLDCLVRKKFEIQVSECDDHDLGSVLP